MTTPTMVVFDLGGVLIRICRTWSEACAAAGLPVRGETASISTSNQRHVLAERHGLGQIESSEFFRLVSGAMGGLYAPHEVKQVHDAWLLGEYPGVHDLIRDIRGAGLATGVLSNTNHAHWVRLTPQSHGGANEFAAPGLVDHLHASHLMKLLKPDPAIYAAFEQLTNTRGPNILFFDDLEENIAAARTQGWQAEQIDHAGDTAAQMREHLRNRGLSLDGCHQPRRSRA